MVPGRMLVVLFLTLYTASAWAQLPPPLTGDYTGTLGPIHLVLRFSQTEAGKPTATLDSPDQGASGIPADTVAFAAGHLSATFVSLHATYTADESSDGKTLTGTWTQSSPTPLILHLQAPFVPAATPSAIDGDWTGALSTGFGPLTLLLHIKSDHNGTELLTFDSPTQHANGLIADSVVFANSQLTFDLPAVHGHYTGQLAPGGSTLSGTWNQGTDAPLVFTHVIPFVPAAQPSLADGEWTGTVTSPQGTLHVLLHIRGDRAGTEYVTLDSPDQLATGYEAAPTVLQGTRLTFDLPQLHGTFTGTLSPTSLDGTWTHGNSMPAHFTHPPAHPPPALAQASTPLSLANISARLDTELKPLVENPTLAGANGIGVAIGIVSHGERRVLTYGTATPASVFEIGSITKTFTALLLAQAVTAGTVQLDTPVRALLPSHTFPDPNAPNLEQITLLSLATHHSGLPRLPDNLRRADPLNPYADYTQPLLYTFLSTHGTARPPAAPFLYSNVGAALLGQALAARANLPYATLLQRDILAPLHLTHTSLTAQPMPGHNDDDTSTPAWDLNAIAPAGGLRSDIADLLTYTEAQLHPPPAFAAAIALQHTVQADTPTGKIALAWFVDPATGDYSHDGATGGFSSYAFFNPIRDLAAVVLVNRSSALASSLAQQIAALLEGRTPDPLRR